MAQIAWERLGLSTLAYRRDGDLPGIVRRAHELGFAAVDLVFVQGYAAVGLIDLADHYAELVGPLADVLDETGVTVSTCNVNLPRDLNPEEQYRQAHALIRAAAELKVTGGITLGHPMATEGLQASIDFLTPLVALFRNHGLTPMVESHVRNWTETPSNALALLEAVPGLMFTMDGSHYIRQGLTPADWVDLYPYVRHVHTRPSRPGELSCPVAEATDDEPNNLAALLATGYQGTVTMETEKLDTAEQDALDHREVLLERGLLAPRTP